MCFISGAYLIACGPRGALIFMSWLGINVLPKEEIDLKQIPEGCSRRPVGSIITEEVEVGVCCILIYILSVV